MKLGKRLTRLDAMVAPGYDHIWDCCCDHGLLGAALLARSAAPWVHFVDRVPELMDQLEHKLKRFFPPDPQTQSRWQLHCADVASLKLTSFAGRQLIIIAGVGGDLIRDFVKALYRQHPQLRVDFLLCPVHHQFQLREQLIALNFSLLDEALVRENDRFYEILWVSSQAPQQRQEPIAPAGSLIWQTKTPEQREDAQAYRDKTLAHYRRRQRQAGADVEHILAAYTALTIC